MISHTADIRYKQRTEDNRERPQASPICIAMRAACSTYSTRCITARLRAVPRAARAHSEDEAHVACVARRTPIVCTPCMAHGPRAPWPPVRTCARAPAIAAIIHDMRTRVGARPTHAQAHMCAPAGSFDSRKLLQHAASVAHRRRPDRWLAAVGRRESSIDR